MKPLIIDSTSYSPKVILDINDKTLSFNGECRPENVSNFFIPIIAWFEGLKSEEITSENIPITFNLDYFNSSSSKHLMDLFFLIRDLNDDYNYNLDIVWEYDEDDEDVYEAGIDFQDLSGVIFIFKAI